MRLFVEEVTRLLELRERNLPAKFNMRFVLLKVLEPSFVADCLVDAGRRAEGSATWGHDDDENLVVIQVLENEGLIVRESDVDVCN